MLGEKRQHAQNQWGTSPGSLGRGRSTVPAEKVRENPRAPLTPSATDSLGHGRSTVPAEKVRENPRAPLAGSAADGPQSLPKRNIFWGQSKYKPQEGETWLWNIFLPGCFFPQSYACLRVWGKCQSKYKPQQGATIPKNVPMEPKIKDVLMEPNIKEVFRSQM
jgi:hypothetical protein